MEEALMQSRGIIHGLSAIDEHKQEHLGPVIKAQVELEGVDTDALLHTGTPATTVSLEFLVKARLKQKPANQSREEWEESFKETVQLPEVTLWGNYMHVNTVGQTEVTIKRGSYSLEATVQVQRKGPVPLLIVTNLQSELEFLFL